MAIEPNIDPPGTGYLDDLVSSNPDGAVSEVRELDNHVRGIKNVLLRTFAAITGAVTASQTEINKLAGVVAGTVSAGFAVVVDSSKNIGTFGVVTATTFVGNLTGHASTATSATVLTGNLTGDVTSTGMATTLTSAAVGAKTAVLDVDAIGSYIFASRVSGTTIPGATLAGTLLQYAGVFSTGTVVSYAGTVGVGTWMCMGYAPAGYATVWKRVS